MGKSVMMIHKDFPKKNPVAVDQVAFDRVWKDKGWKIVKDEQPAKVSKPASSAAPSAAPSTPDKETSDSD